MSGYRPGKEPKGLGLSVEEAGEAEADLGVAGRRPLLARVLPLLLLIL